MVMEGPNFIDMKFLSETGDGDKQQKKFGVDQYTAIEWRTSGVPVVALESPDFAVIKGEKLKGSRYHLHFTINSKQSVQSHRNVDLQGPMPINDVTLFDAENNQLLNMPRFNLFEFWCSDNNVERWHPEKDEKDRLLQEAHEVWRHQIQQVFERISSVRVSFQVQPAYWYKCE